MGVKETFKKAGSVARNVGETAGEAISIPIKFVGGVTNKIDENIENALHLKEALKKLFALLKELFGGKKAVMERLDDIEKQINQSIDNGDYTNEQLQKLSETVSSLAGKMRNMSPEAMEATELEAVEELEKLMNSMNSEGRLWDAKTDEPNFFAALKTLSGHEDMDDETFEKYFSKNAKLFDNGHLKPETKIGEDGKEHNQTEGTSIMLIELDGKCFQAKFNVSETRPTEENPEIKTRDIKLSVSDFKGSYNDAKEISVKPELGSHETMMREFLLPRGLRRQEDFERIDVKRLEKKSTAYHDYSIIKKYSENVIESQDGKNEFFYDKKNNIFIARDKETGAALVFKMVKQELQMITLDNTESIDEIIASGGGSNSHSFRGGSENVNEQAAFRYDMGKGITHYSIANMDMVKSSLFRTPQVMEFVSTKGINGSDLVKSLIANISRNSKGYSRVAREGMDKVDRMYDALYSTIEASDTSLNPKSIRDSRKFRKFGSNGAVYLSVNDNEGNSMSFTFNEDGSPQDLNYKAKDGKKFRFAQNFTSNHYGADYETVRYEEHFAQLLSICQKAYSLYADNEAKIDRNIIEDNKETEQEEEQPETTAAQEKEIQKWCKAKSSAVTDKFYKEIPLLQASANYVIQNRHLSVAQIQRTFGVDYRQAEKVIQKLEKDGLISNANDKIYRLAVEAKELADWKPASFTDETKPAPTPAPSDEKNTKSPKDEQYFAKKWASDVTRLVYPDDELYAACVNYAMQKGIANTPKLQRAFRIGWNKVSKIFDQMKESGIIDNDGNALVTPKTLAERNNIEYKPLPLSDENIQIVLNAIQDNPDKTEFDRAFAASCGVNPDIFADIYDTLQSDGVISDDNTIDREKAIQLNKENSGNNKNDMNDLE